MEKQADPYTMNQDHKNNPIKKYENWDTQSGGEAQDMKTPWTGEGRTETGHPAPAKGSREAVVSARQMEDKALKCITIAQRMLPGASDALIEEQATDFMYLPEHCVMATLQRQSRLAEVLASECKDEEEEADAEASKKPKDEAEEVEAGKKKEEETEEVEAGKKKEEETEEVEAGKKKEEEEEADAEASKKKATKKAPPAEEEKKPEEVEAKKEAPVVPPVEEEEKKPEEVEAKKAPVEEKKPEEEEPVMASDADLLDQIFAQDDAKAGAKKLSGIVKQASTENALDNLWDAPPDVSKVFGR